MKRIEMIKVSDIVRRKLPREKNWKLIDSVVVATIKAMENRPWYKRLFKL